MIASSSPHVGWPWERFYWSVLDVPAARPSGPLPAALLPEFGDDVPVDVDKLFAIAVPTACGRTLVCAAMRDELEGVPGHVLSLAPESIPDELGVEAEVSGLNFLVGPFEPVPTRRRRQYRHLAWMAITVVVGGLVTLGLARRAARCVEEAGAARTLANAVVQRVLPNPDPAWAERSLDAELVSLRTRAKASDLAVPSPDAALHLAQLLTAWPAQVPCKPQSLSVTPTSMMASVSIEGDPSGFLKAIRAPAGWTLGEPRINSASGITRLSLQMKPEPRPGREGAP